MASTTTAPFIVASAFSTGTFDGNPAAVIFVDLKNIELSALQGLSKNFNQPMMAFITQPTSPEPGVVSADIRYLTATGVEVTLCGHATIVATGALLSLPEFKNATPPIQQARFQTLTRGIVTVDILEGGWYELSMPAAVSTLVPDDEAQKLAAMFNKAFGREVVILNIRTGGEDYPYLLMAEIEESEDLRGAAVDVSAFKDSKFSINGVTSRTTSSLATGAGEEYHCRMFSPLLPGGEDPVCGSLQTLLVPYWSQKKDIASGTPFVGLHVGPRGGVVQAVWDEPRSIVKLRGQTHILSRGECFY